MSHVFKVPNKKYRLYVLLPLIAVLLVLIGIELKKDIIPDGLIFPAGLYFTVMAARVGPLRWWRYPLALLSILIAMLVLAYTWQELSGCSAFGGGAIKLMAVVGGSVGLVIGFETMAIWLLVVTAAIVFTNISALPSSPLVGIALYIALARRYGFNFLFSRTKVPDPIVEADAPIIDKTLTITSNHSAKQLPAFFKLPQTPSLLLQGGGLLAVGGGFLSRQLQKTPDHSMIAALAIEGLRVASFVGIVCFIIGWVKTRKQK